MHTRGVAPLLLVVGLAGHAGAGLRPFDMLRVAQSMVEGREPQPAPKYEWLLRGGHVIDPRTGISALHDVAIAAGRVAAITPQIAPTDALKTIDVSGLYVVPGLVDIHTHVYAGTGEKGSYAGDNSLYPDGFTLRACVTTVADAGGAGWRNFEDFKQRIIDRSKTRVLAFLNIVGHGMRGGSFEQDLADMAAQPAADMARRYRGVIVGVKTAHYQGPEWTPVQRAVDAGTLADVPVMVDFGAKRAERPLAELVTRKLRPGDIYTHVFSGLRGEQDESGRVNSALWEARTRGVLFDVGHGASSFVWRIAVPAVKERFLPDSISTDLHVTSMNAGMKDMLRHGKVPGHGADARRCGSADNVERRARDQAGWARPSVRGCHRRRGRPAIGTRQLWFR
ncbi:MAG: amidohydrolase/deacetylase family metallohydrolase [Vicinamibacterales bacterium]